MLYALLIGLAALYLIPVYVVIVGSLKTGTEISTTSIWAPPSEVDLGAWGSALTLIALVFVCTMIARLISARFSNLNA